MRLLKFNFHGCFSLFIGVTAMFFLSCTEEKEELRSPLKVDIPTYSVVELDSVLPQLTVVETETFELPEFSVPYFLEPFSKGQYVVAAEREDKAILLFDGSGNYLGKAGGEGRGPGEFLGLIKLNTGSDDHLYTHDSRLRRISRFKVDREGFSLVDTYSPSVESLMWLHNMYVTEWGNFAVYREMVDINTGQDKYHFYKLDDEFNQVERLITMPGNEKMPLDESGPITQYIDHMVGEKTLWDLDSEWFYYISSHSPVINKFNIRTGKFATDTFFNLEEREITEEIRSQVMEYSSNMTKRFPIVKDAMEEVKVLPIFEEFVVNDHMIYLSLFDISGSEKEFTEIIRINEKTEEVHYLKIPLKLSKIQGGDGMMYGIEFADGDYSSIRIIDLRES